MTKGGPSYNVDTVKPKFCTRNSLSFLRGFTLWVCKSCGCHIVLKEHVETLTFLGILLFFIVIGNSAVLAALMMGKTQRKSRMNFFIMHLALADLAVGLINVVTDIIWKVTVSWYLGNIACKIIKYFQTVVIYASNYVLVALSIDRYDAITHPLKFSGSWRRARLLIATAWGLSFTFSLPSAFLFHEKNIETSFGSTVTQCWIDMKPVEWQVYMTIISIALFIIPAFIIAICYTIMVHTIWTQSRILTPSSKKTSNGIFRRGTCKGAAKTDDDDSRRASSRGLIPKAKIKSVKMTFVIVFVFICCSSPYVVFSLLQVYNFIPRTQTMTALSTFFTSLSPLNSAANPIIYCMFSTHICRNLRKIRIINWFAMRCCPNLGKSSPTTGNKRRFGAGASNQDTSQKRTDFSSLTDSLMSRSDRITQSTIRSSTNNGIRRHEGPGSILNKEVKFQTPNSGTVPHCPQNGS
ncbi:Cardioacceleratory peptide receptor [Orchesella cincta]|uniref:Cardioacceleratory peptide receptor n=1 Tax=Orchesella cincta TaxID=48709 RepID=A0A1D2N4M9_ORCCI|nr:Cardioacceleratory peptide receptor [Orchesella cincta]